MKRAYLYCDKRSLNDATVYYVDLVNDCLRTRGYNVEIVHLLKDIKNPDLIFTITSVNFIKAKIRFPFVKTLNWVQGLGVAEAKMTRPVWKWLPYWFCEQFKILFADVMLFVSEQMQCYYYKYFLYRGERHVIMPCYNLHLGNNFDVSKYLTPTFVYAGGISKWQGIDVLLDTYALIESQISNASLTMYCKERDYIINEAGKRGIKNIDVKYVPLEQLQGELQQYKYGFILREKNWVNYVATPTKMNSYLAAYLIPIFSNGVNDFEKHIKLGEFTLLATTPLNPSEISEQIISFEKSQHDYNEYKSIVQNIFENHYNDEYYKVRIIDKMIECGF